jgi:hypothetical protein
MSLRCNTPAIEDTRLVGRHGEAVNYRIAEPPGGLFEGLIEGWRRSVTGVHRELL